MSILNDLGSISSNLRDYAHGTKIFVDGNYQLAPKYGFLYYVHIESNIVSADSSDIGILVKSAQLPKFSVDLKKLNSYNRPIYAQTKVVYEPVTITFHDDNADNVRNFWLRYFNYYFRDTDNSETQFGATVNAKYDQDRQFSNWGYTPVSITPFFKKITIYSLHKKSYSSYALMNPVIRNFQHGEHSYGATDTMANSMTVEYESVVYGQGKVTENNVPGFLKRYDLHPSPLTPAGGGTASILGQGGLLETMGEIGSDLENGNFGSAIFKGIQGIRNAGSMDLKNAAIGELLDVGKNILRGNNPTKNIFVPTLNSAESIVSGAKNWLPSKIAPAIRSAATRVNNEVSDALSSLTKKMPGSSSGSSFGFGPFSVNSPNAELTDILADQLIIDSNFDLKIPLAAESEALMDQALQVKQPTNQFIVNEPRLVTSLQYNLSVAQQNKIDIQIKIQTIKDQQQMIEDAIVSLTNKRNSLLSNNSTDLLVKQLTLQIEQQQNAISENDQAIANSNIQISQLNKRIELINAKITGLT